MSLYFWRFADPSTDLGPEMVGTYDPLLVVLSVVTACLAGHAGFELMNRLSTSTKRMARWLWLGAGSIAFGGGIWSMHFVGMLAFEMHASATYDVWLTLASMVPALLASGLALHYMNRDFISRSHIFVAGLFLASGIGLMHFLGMEAMRMHAVMVYDPWLFVGSIFVALILAIAALSANVALRRSRFTWLAKPGRAVAMGCAVSGMHYTAMAAARFYPSTSDSTLQPGMDSMSVALVIISSAALVVLASILAINIDRRLSASAELLAESQRRSHLVIQATREAFIGTDAKGYITDWNPAAERMFGFDRDEALGLQLLDTIVEGRFRGELEREIFSDSTAREYMEVIGTHRDGHEIPLEYSVSRLSMQGEESPLLFLRDASAHKAATAILEEARRHADETSRAKSEFLANMSHELRTPMNGIIGMTELLLDSNLDDEQREFAQAVSTSAAALLSILNSLLDFSKIEADKLELEQVDFDLRLTVEGVLDVFALTAAKKGIEFSSIIDHDVCSYVRGDPGRLRQILVNLTGNAIKFTETGEVLIRVSQDDSTGNSDGRIKLRFEVSDTGIGVAQDKLDILFDSFTQADSSTTRRFGGTGLGLAISKRLVELMDGEIGVESTPGKGSTFWFTVNLDASSVQSDEQTSSISDMRILIVDDHPTNRRVLSEQLRRWGCLYDEAEDGPQALKKLRDAAGENSPFDVALLDMMMPDMDGEKLSKLIKEDPTIRSTVLVMLSSMGHHHDLDLVESGLAGYLVKPVKHSRLYDCLASIHGSNSVAKQASSAKAVPARRTVAVAKDASVRILLAEDNAVNRGVALGVLGKLGYQAQAVNDGRQALEAISKERFDVVLMDVRMPGMDGLEATAQIRERERDKDLHTPIIAMTAEALAGDRERCLAAGMDDYVSKPINRRELARAIEKALASRQSTAHSSLETFDHRSLLERLDGDESLAGELLDLFVEALPSHLEALETALHAKSAEQVERVAHEIKGATANIAALALNQVTIELEESVKAKDMDTAVGLFSKLQLEFERFRTKLEDMRSTR